MKLTCVGLDFTYPNSETSVIENLSFSMANPGFNAVFGPSGSGKTTFAKILSNSHDRIGREILLENIEKILYSYNLERLPGWSNIGKHLDKVTVPGKRKLKERLTEIFGLNDLLGSRFSQLSMGQQNRINLVRYLLQDFDLLILDESLANVDEKLRENIILGIKELFPDRMFLYISHHLMEVSKFCRKVLVFSKPSTRKGYSTINGRDYKMNYLLDKKKLDETMLEIMNAF